MPDATCTADDCTRPALARGLCSADYQRRRRAAAPACSTEECDRPAHARGLCDVHYRRWSTENVDRVARAPCTVCAATIEYDPRRRRPPKTCGPTCWRQHLRTVRGAHRKPPPTEKRCTKCGQTWPAIAEHFAPSKRHSAGLYPYCRPCVRQRRRDWEARHPDRARASRKAYAVNSGAQRRGLPGQHQMGKLILAMQSSQSGRCFYCCDLLAERGFHVDHVTPIRRGGQHEPGNLCLACQDCNLSKNASTVAEWRARSTRCASEQIRAGFGLAPLGELTGELPA